MNIHKNGTKVDLSFNFCELRLKVTFDCSVSIYVLSNTHKIESEDINFDVVKTKFIGKLNKTVKTSMILFPHKKNEIELNILLLTKKGKKCAGSVILDMDEIFKNPNEKGYVKPLEKCPDRNAKISFKLSYANFEDLKPIDSGGGKKKDLNTTNMSFYSHFNNEETSFNKNNNSHNTSGLSLKVRQIARNRSKSPGGGIKLNFGGRRIRPQSRSGALEKRLSNKNFTSDRKNVSVRVDPTAQQEKSKANIFDNYYGDKQNRNVDKDVEEHKKSRTEHEVEVQSKHDSKKFKDLEDNFMIVNNDNSRLKRENNELKKEVEFYRGKLGGKADEVGEIEKLKKENDQLREEIEQKEETIFEKKLNLEESENRYNDIKSKNFEQRKRYERDIKELNMKLQSLQSGSNDETNKQSKVLQDRISELEKKYSYLKGKNDELEEENYHLEEKHSDAKQKVFDLETQIETIKDEYNVKIKEIEGKLMIESKNKEMNEREGKRDKEKYNDEVKLLKDENKKFADRIRDLKEKRKELEIEIEIMKEERRGNDESLILDNTNAGELKLELEKTKRELRDKDRELQKTKTEAVQFKKLKEKEIEEFDKEVKILSNEIENLLKNQGNEEDDKGVWQEKYNKAKKALDDKDEEIIHLRSKQETLEINIDDAEQKLKRERREKEDIEEMLEQMKIDKNNNNNNINNSQRDLIKNHQIELDEKNETIRQLKQDVFELEDKVNSLEKAHKRLEDKKSGENDKEMEKLRSINEELQSDIDKKNKELDSIRNDLAELEKKMGDNSEVQKEMDQFQKKLDEVNAELDKKEKEISDLKEFRDKVQELENENNNLKKQVEKKQQKALYESDDLALLTVENENLKKKVKMLNIRINDSKSLEAELEKFKKIEIELQTQVDDLAMEKQNLQDKIEKIEKGQIGGINKSQYSKLEKNYVDSMKKIGDVLMIVQSLKLKKNDKDKIISTLVS